ncbi:MAG: hypothetical protein JWO89_2146 [Verrucomicrobiaceae bacterium]|nr:hypothetical protein [Verrucomicrobiaceae bacterium]
MKRINVFRILVGLALIVAIKLHAQDDAPVEVIAKALSAAPPAAAAPAEVVDKDCPVIVPALDHYAKLWTNSLFTSRALPPPEAPAGPNFTDNLSLSGTYEEKGKLTAILIDKSTSSVVLAYIGEDNPEGFRIVKVTPGVGPDQMKLQLQKGSQFGWVGFSNDVQGEAPPVAAPQSVLGTRNAVPSPARNLNNRSFQGAGRSAPMPPPLPVPLTEPAAPPPAAVAAPAENSLRGGMPQAAPAVPVDIPLPPP